VPPLQFQEKIEICLKKMDNTETIDLWLSGIFLNEYIDCIAPPWNRDAALNSYVEKLNEAR
jgi:hypothetical protein